MASRATQEASAPPRRAEAEGQVGAPAVPQVARPHRLIATIACDRVEDAARALATLPHGVAEAEVRLDRLWPTTPDEEAATDALLQLVDAAAQADVSLIATLRPVRQGGGFSGEEQVRLGLLAAAAQAGFAAVDLESDVATPPLLDKLRAMTGRPLGAIVSSHHVGPTPCKDDGLTALTMAQDAGGDLDKFVFFGSSYTDTLRSLEVANQHNARGGRPIVQTTGQGDPQLRALLAIAGNHATYGHASGSPPAAPGQPSIADIAAVLEHWGLAPVDLAPHPAGARAWLAVLGHPVGHTLSPRIQNAALRASGRPERFGALDVPASLGALLVTLHAAQRIGLVACSVMAPHKRDLARIADCDPVATAVGAANCARFEGGATKATNTDATALRRVLEPHIDEGLPAVVIGSGASARAAIWALDDLGATVRFTSRDPQRAADAAKLGGKWLAWGDRKQLRAPIWVQATPGQAASASGTKPRLVDRAQLDGARLAIELDYANGPTPFEEDAAAAGAEVIDGRRMLVEQGVDAFRFWTGAEADRDAMMTAVAVHARLEA